MDMRTYALKHGGFPSVAATIGFNAEFLRQVAKGRRRFSAESALIVETKTNGLISRHELRPDLWLPEPARAKEPLAEKEENSHV